MNFPNHPRLTRTALIKLRRALLPCMVLLAGCTHPGPVPESSGSVERWYTKISMKNLVADLPPGYWEGSPEHFLQSRYPRGVPNNYVAVDAKGAQASIQALRLDGATLAVIQRSDERSPTSGFRVLRRMDCGWMELTTRVLPPRVSPGSVSRLTPDGSVVVSTRRGDKMMRFDGTRFVQLAGQNTAGSPRPPL